MILFLFEEINVVFFMRIVVLVEFLNAAFVICRKWKEIVDEWVRLNPQGGNNTLMGNLNIWGFFLSKS